MNERAWPEGPKRDRDPRIEARLDEIEAKLDRILALVGFGD